MHLTNIRSHSQLDMINPIAILISKDLGIPSDFTGSTVMKAGSGVYANRRTGIRPTPSMRTVVMVTRTLGMVELTLVFLNQVRPAKTCLGHTGCRLMTAVRAHHSTSKLTKIDPKLSLLHVLIYLPPPEIYNTVTLLSVGQLQKGVWPEWITRIHSLPKFKSLW